MQWLSSSQEIPHLCGAQKLITVIAKALSLCPVLNHLKYITHS